MKRAIICGLAFLACAALLSNNVARADDEERLLPDTSRASRFRLVIRETIKELGLDISILSAEIVKRFTFPSDVEEDSIFGIDISHHNEDGCNCKINWSDVEGQKVKFAYLKATQGATGQDARFSANWNLVAQTSILRGAYHFLSPFSTPEDQVKNFLKMMGPLQPNDLPPVMDIEWTDPANPENDGWKNKSPNEIVEFVLKWLTAVEDATKRTPVIYTSRVWWKDRITDANLSKFQRYPIWLAQYVPDSTKGQDVPKNLPAAWTTWAMWQFTESGGFTQGLKAAVDVSVFKGNLEKFHQTFGIALPPPVTGSNDKPKPDTPIDANLTPGGGTIPGDSTTPSDGSTPSGPSSGSSGGSPPAADPAKDASVATPDGGNTASGNTMPTPTNTPSGPAMPTVTNMPSGPASGASGASTPKADPTKDANLGTPNSGNPPTSANPASSSSTNAPKSGPANKPSGDGFLGTVPGNSSPPRTNRGQSDKRPGDNPDIRME